MAKFRLVLRAYLEKQFTPPVFQPAYGLLMFSTAETYMAHVPANGFAFGQHGLLLGRCCAELFQMFDEVRADKVDAGVRRGLGHARSDRVPFLPASLELLPPLAQATLYFCQKRTALE